MSEPPPPPGPHSFRLKRNKSPALTRSSPLNPSLNSPIQSQSPALQLSPVKEEEEEGEALEGLSEEFFDAPSDPTSASNFPSPPSRPPRSPPRTPLPAVPRPEIRVIPPTGESHSTYSLDAYFEAVEDEEGRWDDPSVEEEEDEEEAVIDSKLEERMMREFGLWAEAKDEKTVRHTREEKGKGKATELGTLSLPEEPAKHSPPFEDFGVDLTTTPPASASTISAALEREGSGGSDTTVKAHPRRHSLSRSPTPPHETSPEIVTPHSRFTQAMGLAPSIEGPGFGDDADTIKWLKGDIENLQAEKDEMMEENRNYWFMLQAMNDHADQLLVTITPQSLVGPILELCASFQDETLAQIVRFRTQVGTLARAVGSPPPNTNRLLMDTSILETFARVVRVMVREYDPLDNFLFVEPGNVSDYIPPDILWLFVHTAEEDLLVQLREVLTTFLNTCAGSRRAVVLKLLLRQVMEDRLDNRRKTLPYWQQWARRQRLLFERNGNRLQVDDERVKQGDLRRLRWEELDEYVTRDQKAKKEWDEAF
ncbi:hypothetical protein IAR55_001638 [Kwoniella newhampshirensis]|uniref:Uncharacterized protein n=1 Tax=Kwoniella newhampshirensis TaxID=1651941 RepID=A0AAW0Z2T7_9TREE